jgi:hypothetical protein
MTTAPVGCLDGEQAIRDALAEGPTSGPWVADDNEGFSSWTVWSRMTPSGNGKPGPMVAQVIGDSAEADANAALVAACHPETMRTLLAELDRLRSASRQEGWQPIADAPEDVLLVVGWLDAEDEEHPERHDFDYLEDGIWQKHSENVEYFQVCAPAGSRGPREQAPYTHFMPVGSIPAAPHQAQEAQGDRHGG